MKVAIRALIALLLAPSAAFHVPAGLRVNPSPLLSRPAPLALKAGKPAIIRAPPPVAAEAAAAPGKQWDASFRRRRLAIFAFTVVAYSAYYLVRNSIYYTAPAMVAAPDLNIDITAIGVISSVFPLTCVSAPLMFNLYRLTLFTSYTPGLLTFPHLLGSYGCSKFVSGVVGDVLSPRAMLASGKRSTQPNEVPRQSPIVASASSQHETRRLPPQPSKAAALSLSLLLLSLLLHPLESIFSLTA